MAGLEKLPHETKILKKLGFSYSLPAWIMAITERIGSNFVIAVTLHKFLLVKDEKECYFQQHIPTKSIKWSKGVKFY